MHPEEVSQAGVSASMSQVKNNLRPSTGGKLCKVTKEPKSQGPDITFRCRAEAPSTKDLQRRRKFQGLVTGSLLS